VSVCEQKEKGKLSVDQRKQAADFRGEEEESDVTAARSVVKDGLSTDQQL
jgi:hypothetical protein